jgi:CrcB protein
VTALTWAGVAVLGGIGAVARFILDGTIGAALGRDFPWGTLVVNVSGSLVLGILSGLGTDDSSLLLAGTALLGSYTTFSTWMLETHGLAEEGESGDAVRNIVISLALGLAAAALGRLLGGMHL